MGQTRAASTVLPIDVADPRSPARYNANDTMFVLSESDFTFDIENDCACPETPFLINPGTGVDVSHSQTKGLLLRDLPDGFTLAFSPFARGGPCVLSPGARRRLDQFASPLPLELPIDERLASEQLIQPESTTPGMHSNSKPARLTAWIHVTNACDLNCPYCYVRKSPDHMSEEVGYRALDQVFAAATQNGFKSVKLKYAGGEATLNLRLVRQLHAYGRQLAATTDIELREVLLSNGVRIRADDADWLAESSIKLMISLDGIGDTHDMQRPTVGGRGSFAALEQTIDNVLLPRGLKPEISVTVTRQNALHASDAVTWALRRNLPFSLNFYRETTLTASRADLALEEDLIIEGMRRVYAVIETNLPTRPLLNGLLDRMQAQAHTHTCGVGLSYMVITHEGRVSQCQMHQSEAYELAAESDPLQLVARGPIQNISVDNKEGCRECSYRYRCTGGCPIETFRATGRWDVQSPHCRIYRALFPDALRLEGLRLLKLNSHFQ